MSDKQTSIIYEVNSDLDDELLFAEFNTEEEALKYAKENIDRLPFVDKVEVIFDDQGEVIDIINRQTIWAHNNEVYPTNEDEEEDYWDMLCAEHEDQEYGRHVMSGTLNGINADNLVETLEENETDVECKECFDLFPKDQCVKVAFGYICPTCSKCEVADDEIFKIDFPEYEKFPSENEMIPGEPNPEPMPDMSPNPEPMPSTAETENEPISEPEEVVPFLVKDEEEAITGYEEATAVIQDSEIENKDEILDTLDHIKEEEKEHIEELQDLGVEETQENENDPESIEEDYIIDQTSTMSYDDLYKAIVTEGDLVTIMIDSQTDNNGNQVDQSWEICDADGVFSVVEYFYNVERDEVEEGEFVFESDDFDTFYAALARKNPEVFSGKKTESLKENAQHAGGFRTDGYRTAYACYDSDDFDINNI